MQLTEGNQEIPIGQEFGIKLSFLDNPQSTRPSDSFSVSISDVKENLIVNITSDEAKLTDFVMKATQPSEFIYSEVQSDVK